ncbi:hypothetical protein EXIGLDRAFT_139472 [Exidia glandulosa HHB12029]|uniref:DUF6533 domain-containing protein n=1 Tax=Exidia glandulosa HHB12029 TaxID=1314781 RepID=A0A165FYG9_EXIGL|nr:hypothetical protein EXIGLDRAFT_139472 [Exidia glandulosa HHB12029]
MTSASGSVDPELAQVFPLVVQIYTTARYLRLVSVVWLAWDTILTLPTEIRCIWGHKFWTVPVLLYLIVRYLPLFAQIFSTYAFFNPTSLAICTAWFEVGAWSECITVLCTHAILIYRLHALYANRRILYSMVAWAVINGAAAIAVDAWTQSRTHRTNQFFPGVALYGCGAAADSPHPDYFYVGWLPVLLTEAYLFALSAWKLRERLHRAQFRRSGGSLSDVLLADSFKYYLVVVAVELFQVIVWATLDWEQYTDPFTAAVLPIAGTRLILNLRDVAKRGVDSDDTVHDTTTSDGAGITSFEFAVRRKRGNDGHDTERGTTFYSNVVQ